MAFLDKDELKSVAYEYQLTEITESDDDILEIAIATAIEEMKSYLRPGRNNLIRYDVDTIFNATGSERNALILAFCKSIALWYACELSNVDIILEKVKDRYDRAIDWLKLVTGAGQSPDVQRISPGLPILPDPSNVKTLPYRMGSRMKFDHEGTPQTYYIDESQ
jgi:phage gp36-like protein